MKKSRLIPQEREESEKMEWRLAQIEEAARETEDYCECIMAKLIDTLQRHYCTVKKLIEDQEAAAIAHLHGSNKMKTRLQADDVQVLQVSKHLFLPFESIKKDFEHLGEHVEAFCDKEFASILQTVYYTTDSGDRGETGQREDDVQQNVVTSTPEFGFSGVMDFLTELTTEPKTRAEFLKYAFELTLDSTTAHEDLVLSERSKVVSLCPRNFKCTTGHYPEQFLHRRQVLCKEGLQAKCCYYEVEVYGDKVEIALAYKRIDRKSRMKSSAFGANENSWSLDRYLNYSVSHRSNSVQLTTRPCHDRIGVFLKFHEGTVSFYEVSESMIFLYQVKAKFVEPLYPGFWLGEKCSIRLCDLRLVNI